VSYFPASIAKLTLFHSMIEYKLQNRPASNRAVVRSNRGQQTTMFKKLYYALAGDRNEKVLKKFRPVVETIGGLEKTFERKSNEELRAMTQDFRSRIVAASAELREALAEAEQEYLDVLGTDEQKFARVELDRIKELRKEEEKLLWENPARSLRCGARGKQTHDRAAPLRRTAAGRMASHSGRIAR
jgi:preprotein translocase subunit SecA